MFVKAVYIREKKTVHYFDEKRVRLLKTTYKKNTISEMVYKYAPPKENDTERYVKLVTSQAKVSRDDVVGDISEAQFAQMLEAMGKHEGWIVGTIKELGKPAKVVLQDKLQQPLVNKPIQLKSADKKIELKTDHRGELPSIYPKLFKEEVDLFYDGLLKTKEKTDRLRRTGLARA